MSASSPRSANRVIVVLGLLLLTAVALVAWLALRGEPDAPADKPPTPVEKPRPAAPVAPRPKAPEIETLPYRPAAAAKPPVEEEPEPAPKPLTLDVEVTGVNGLPAPGATVVLVNALIQSFAMEETSEFARGTTDAAGHAQFVVTGRTVRAFAWLGGDAGASDKIRPSPKRTSVAVKLASAIPVKGRVVEAAGERPVAGASVRFAARPWFQDVFGLALETRSGPDGAFELPPVPASAFEFMTSNAAAVEARAKGWPTASVSVTADVLRAGEVVVRLDRGAFVRGRLLDPNGAVARGWLVELADGRAVAAPDADGRFEVPLPREGGAVLALRDGKGIGVGGHLREQDRGSPKLLGRFRGDAGDLDLGDVTLAWGGPVKGVVLDLDEKPVKGGDVALTLAGVVVATTRTDDAGAFDFTGVSDDAHALTAAEPAGENTAVGRRHATVEGVRGGGADVRVVLSGALTVVVKFLAAADNTPVVVSEVALRVVPADPTVRGYRQQWVGTGIDSARIEVERAGKYDVSIDVPGYETETASGVEVAADREARIDVLFRKKP